MDANIQCSLSEEPHLKTTPPFPISPAILCGGSRTRLRPVSRKAPPNLIGAESLFQGVVRRATKNGVEAPIEVTGDPFSLHHRGATGQVGR